MAEPVIDDESARAAGLLEAQEQAAELFEAIGSEGILRPGVRDSEASQAVVKLAAERFGVQQHWHKRIVRSGPNTLQPYSVDPPDRLMTADDIAFADFGPVFGRWEADFGRTWVLGTDPVKRRLCDDLELVFSAGKQFSGPARMSLPRSCTPKRSGWPRRAAGPSGTCTAATSSVSIHTRTYRAAGSTR